jgi:hypothetical protein
LSKRKLFLAVSIPLIAILAFQPLPVGAQSANIWKAESVPAQSHITGGPWTLEQTGSSNAAPSAGYCVNGVPQANPGTERMAPYYFPFVTGSGKKLHGIFDYRPRTSNEAVVAASTRDGGLTWQFEQQVLELNKGICPASDLVDIGNDNGLGHGYSMKVNGETFLYNLDRKPGNVDQVGMVVHQLTPEPGAPLNPVPATLESPLHTTGLLNPDGIIAEVPGVSPRTVFYLQKILNGDQAGPTALPAAQRCGKPVIFKEPAASHDIVIPRMASTTDGINFTDLGPLNGLNDPAAVGPTEIRYVGPRGTILRLSDGKWGLFFSGGNCLDGDSDAFHFLGYAESSDLRNWTVINGIQNPIASIAPLTVIFNGSSVTVPATQPVAGNTQGWFEGRVYSPSFTLSGEKGGILHFAGYHTPRPNDDRSDYRNIGRVALRGTHKIVAISNGSDDRDSDHDDADNH